MKKNSIRSSKNTKASLLRLWREALRRANPAQTTFQFIRRHRKRFSSGVRVVAIGKAAVPMVQGAKKALRSKITDGLVIFPRNQNVSSKTLSPFTILRSDHPFPTAASLRAGKKLFAFANRSDSAGSLLFLISGGASALAVLPRKGITFRKKQKRIRTLLLSGASIRQLNRLRISLSAIKGGRILRHVSVPVTSLIASDVVTDDLRTIASGLTVSRSPKSNVRNHLLLSCSTVAQILIALLKRKNRRVTFRSEPITGDAFTAGRKYARTLAWKPAGSFHISYGETVVHVQGKGRGGRNTEFALGAAIELQKIGRRISLLSIATDGSDGNSNAAGAFIDETTIRRARILDLDPYEFLRKNDSASFFDAMQDLVKTGPTGVNFADLQIAYIA